MFIGELEHPRFAEFDLSTLRTGIMAGSPCPIEVMKKVIARMNMREVTICYGMTETSPVSTQTGAEDPLEKRVGTVGRVHPHVEVKIVSPETGEVVRRGERGEVSDDRDGEGSKISNARDRGRRARARGRRRRQDSVTIART
jgi:fatty-acyl-CoA synthase